MADPARSMCGGRGHGRRSAAGRGEATTGLPKLAAATHEEDEHNVGGMSLPSVGGAHGPRSDARRR